MLLIQVSLCYIVKHLEDRKAWYVHIYYTCCDIILISKLRRRTWLTPRSSIHSLKIRMTPYPCNKYEHTTLSYLLSVKYKYEVQPKSIDSFSLISCYVRSKETLTEKITSGKVATCLKSILSCPKVLSPSAHRLKLGASPSMNKLAEYDFTV